VAMLPYVSPEQSMKDRADYARKGISRGRSVVGVTYADGVVFVAENPSTTLHKISEIYDRIAFAAVGKYNEFESLRRQGIRLADLTGYQYAREDVTGRSLANAYAAALGTAFTEGSKPFEVELLIAQVNSRDMEGAGVELYHILYDGSITDEDRFIAIGGTTEGITSYLHEHFVEDGSLQDAVRVARGGLSVSESRQIPADRLEVAGLDRARGRRKFFRLTTEEVAAALDDG
jgi:proteasome alpha subunit